MGELPEIQIQSQVEACRGAGEGADEEHPDQEDVHIEPQGGGEACKGRGEAEPACSPVGATGEVHPEDRLCVPCIPSATKISFYTYSHIYLYISRDVHLHVHAY